MRSSLVKAIIIFFSLTLASTMYVQRNLSSGQKTAIDDCQVTEGRSDLLKWHGTLCLVLSGTLHIFQLLNTNSQCPNGFSYSLASANGCLSKAQLSTAFFFLSALRLFLYLCKSFEEIHVLLNCILEIKFPLGCLHQTALLTGSLVPDFLPKWQVPWSALPLPFLSLSHLWFIVCIWR